MIDTMFTPSIINQKNQPILAIAIPCFNEASVISKTVNAISQILSSLIKDKCISSESFIFFVDDGSSDDTWKKILEFKQDGFTVKGARLSKNFGHQAALFAAYSCLANKCDAVISIDADLQQDINAIPLFLAKYSSGFDVVLGVRRSRQTDGFYKKISAQFFYKLMLCFGVELIPNHADYRLLSNRALEALLLFKEPGIFLRALCLQLGFSVAIVNFDVFPRVDGESKYTLRKMFRLCVDGITSFSIAPLRLVFALGLALFLLSICMTGYVLWVYLDGVNVVPGWASTILPIYFIGGIQLLCLGIFGEYLGKVFIAVKHRPRWIFESIIE